MSEQYPVAKSVQPVSKEYLQANLNRFYELVKLIPGVSYMPNDLLAEEKPDGRVMHAKWDHTYEITDDGKVVGFIMGYERKAEPNSYYPENTVYLSELAVDPNYQHQGYAHKLINKFLSDAIHQGFSELEGEVNFSVQTNSAAWNEPVRRLYEQFGFHEIGKKEYDNRTDIVMKASFDEVILQ